MTKEDIKLIQTAVGATEDGVWGPQTRSLLFTRLGITDAVAPTGYGDPFETALAEILKHEGGFVNHPKDPGGMTNLGITRNTYEAWIGHDASEADMRALTPEKAAPIYRKNYWDVLRCDELHPALALCVFDFGVNAGPARAARYLQLMVGAASDGKVGPATIASAAAFVGRHGAAEAVKHYQQARRGYYRSLRTFQTFGKGWLRRVDEVESAALRLS